MDCQSSYSGEESDNYEIIDESSSSAASIQDSIHVQAEIYPYGKKGHL